MTTAPFLLPDAVHFDDFSDIRAAGEIYLDEQADNAVFDLSPLQQCNGAAVALLMAWLRYAHARGKSVVYAGAPADLQNIVEVTGLSGTLPVR